MYRCGIETRFCNILWKFLRVLIVPLWNWNKKHHLNLATNMGVLIVPLWNWNTFMVNEGQTALRINCTVVELKPEKDSADYQIRLVLIVPLWNWNELYQGEVFKSNSSINCTVVELKLPREYPPKNSGIVLIVPLWNWNCVPGYVSNSHASINCTVVELKPWRLWRTRIRHVCINCTVVELKHCWMC